VNRAPRTVRPVNLQNCQGDINHKEAFNPTRRFRVYLQREGYCDCDVMIEGLTVKVISSGKSYKVFEQYRGKVILLCFTASPARTAWKNNQLIWRPPDKLTLISGTGH